LNERIVVRKGTYHDSAFLMRVTRELKGSPGISDAVVVMGTQMNRELLVQAGYEAGRLEGVTPMDMVVALRGADDASLDAAEAELARLLEGGAKPAEGAGGPPRWRTVQEAAAANPEARLVSVSVPGAYAAWVAHRALDAGRHVFLFSNNVELDDEIALKKRAVELGLLVMGPDCGTAIIGGVGQGFANRVPRGRIGVVGASGTGIQDVTCTIARAGEGISHAIGTGSRDLSVEVNGMMTEFGARLLADDPGTQVIVLIAKHPAPQVADRMHEVLRGLGKPVVVRYLGSAPRPSADGVRYCASIDEAALTAVALANGREEVSVLEPAGAVAARAKEILGDREKIEGRMVGLFGGGSLASEAKVVLGRHDIAVVEPEQPLKLDGPVEIDGHLLVDTGEDFYTVGKPHPMVDQTVRCALIRKAGADPTVGLILLDLVLGYGSHPDPAPEIAEAVADARAARKGGPLVVIASITGTDQDPQELSRQKSALEAAGIEVRPSAARAAMLAAALIGGAERSER
jgi:FdrA protein